MKQLFTSRNVWLYVAGIVLVNVLFATLPLIPLFGTMIPPASLVVGATFILRDLAQRAVGHNVIVPMAIAVAITALVAGPQLALASGLAFAVSELFDYAVYSWSKLTVIMRVLVGSLFALPIDTVVFLYMLPFAGALTFTSVLVMTASKILGVAVAYAIVAARAKDQGFYSIDQYWRAKEV